MAARVITVDQLTGGPVVHGGNVSFEISLAFEEFALARTWFVEAVVLCRATLCQCYSPVVAYAIRLTLILPLISATVLQAACLFLSLRRWT